MAFTHPSTPPPAIAYRGYASSLDPGLRLYASFAPLPAPAPIRIWMHGWHGNVKSGHRDNVIPPPDSPFFEVCPEMRGRGDSGGKPDANGFELQDAVDAIAAARDFYPEFVAHGAPHVLGGSGGGGNVLGLVGKFPDLLASAVCECGIADYALWYEGDQAGEFRDELNEGGWIGGDPLTNAEAYLSRGGRTTAMNLLTPLLLIHGDADPRVPVTQARAYRDAALHHGKAGLVACREFAGVGSPNHFDGMTADMQRLHQTLVARHHATHRQAPVLPEAGMMVVAGFLRTKRFEVLLENINQVALLHYDLSGGSFELSAPSCSVASIRSCGSSGWQQFECRRIGLPEFCRRAALPHPESYRL